MMKTRIANTRQHKYYDLILLLFASTLLISNLGATKLIAFGPVLADGGGLLFPLTYIFDDILTEVYGYQYARRAIWSGFFIMLIATASFTIVGHLPAAPEWHNQEAYNQILGFFPRIVLASLCAYLCGEFINSFLLAKLKIKTRGRKLWLRLIGSTVAGELIDTTIFGLIAFGGLLNTPQMLNFIAVGWAFKVSVEIVLLPVTYRIVNYLKRAEGSDHYDRNTDFTPFRAGIN
jgi:uncharacterized integral membrane protein (TIGR00697 family)